MELLLQAFSDLQNHALVVQPSYKFILALAQFQGFSYQHIIHNCCWETSGMSAEGSKDIFFFL